MSAPVDPPAPIQPSKFELLVKQNELTPEVASQLFHVLSNCEICLLCDDSGSMGNTILEPGSNKQTTRWMELKKLASVVIEFVTAINPNGLDIYFFNRPILRNVVDMSGLQQTFSIPPNGGTPLIGTLKKIYREKANLPDERQLLVVVVTDGESSDGNLKMISSTLLLISPAMFTCQWPSVLTTRRKWNILTVSTAISKISITQMTIGRN